ncbi:MAG: hypothetical protein JXR45_12040 [Deltaproteobacteria bacterium]|nr:hypothetical protein [Deltaproteobacteria bacterium]
MWPLPDAEKVVGNGTADSCNEETLREAVSGGGLVRFDCGEEQAVITVTSEIQINQETVIDGEDSVTLDGGGSSRIFFVSSALSVRNLRFVNGNALGEEESGGAVSGGWRSRVEVVNCDFEDNIAGNAGGAVAVGTGSELTVVSSRFMHNTSRYGGAIYSLWSPLHIVNSSFVENTTAVNAGGGAIGTDGALDPDYRDDGAVGGTIEICGSIFRNNEAYGAGGAAFLWVYPPDVIIIDRCTIEGNILLKDDDGEGLAMGGGMRVSNGEIFIRNSSFISNSAQTHGGGLSLDCEPTCTITNTTIYDNEVVDGFGGAVFGDKIRMNNVTVANNFASGHGGAFFGGEDVTIQNSIIADNHAGNPWGQAYSCYATLTGDAVMQWVSDFEGAGDDVCIPDVLSEDPMLNPPADNGGSTVTMLPDAESPALQAGHDCEPFDQRGEPRDPTSCDLGAVELP